MPKFPGHQSHHGLLQQDRGNLTLYSAYERELQLIDNIPEDVKQWPQKCSTGFEERMSTLGKTQPSKKIPCAVAAGPLHLQLGRASWTRFFKGLPTTLGLIRPRTGQDHQSAWHKYGIRGLTINLVTSPFLEIMMNGSFKKLEYCA